MSAQDEIPLADLGSGGPSAKFPELGVAYEGTITALRRSPQTDFDSGEVMTWKDGSPRMQTVITIKQDANGETVSFYARGGKFTPEEGTGESMEAAIVRAAGAAGAKALRVGDWLRVEHTGLTKPAKKGMDPAKLYTATYKVDKGSVDLGLFSDEG